MKTKLTAMVLAAGAALGAEGLEVSPEVEDTYEDYDEFDNPIEVPVRVRTATARFLMSKFVIEVIYTLEDGEVVDTFGKVWRR